MQLSASLSIFFAIITSSAVHASSVYPSVKFLYIIPSDQIPYENYDIVLGELAKNLRDFFHHHLGRWIRYSPDIYEVIRLNITFDEILSGTKHRPTSNDYTYQNIHNYIRYLVDLIYSQEFHEDNTLFIGIVVNDFGGFSGGNRIASVGTPGLKHYIIDREYYSVEESAGKLHVLYHEVGHSWGLSHEKESVECMNRYWPELNLSSTTTFMSVSAPIRLSFPKMALAEKLLLTDPEYRQCLPYINSSIHPSEYFSIACLFRLPKGQSIDRLASVLVNWGRCRKYPCDDFNCDGIVNIDDLSFVLVNY